MTIINSDTINMVPSYPPRWASCWGEDDLGVFVEFAIKRVIFPFRWIPAGSFSMGTDVEQGRYEDEGPQHRVTITRGFWLAETPCTQAQWRAIMDDDPSHFKGDTRPVEQVSWEDSHACCARLNELLSTVSFCLPKEAQWEYACRAGTNTAYNDGSSCTVPEGIDPALATLGWHGEGLAEGQTHDVRLLTPNAWGLYDMHGNLWEWCEDYWSKCYSPDAQVDPCNTIEDAGRVVRGGCCWGSARGCRSAYRSRDAPGSRDDSLGFRLAAGHGEPGK